MLGGLEQWRATQGEGLLSLSRLVGALFSLFARQKFTKFTHFTRKFTNLGRFFLNFAQKFILLNFYGLLRLAFASLAMTSGRANLRSKNALCAFVDCFGISRLAMTARSENSQICLNFQRKFTLFNAKIYKISKTAKKIHAQGVNLSAFCAPFSVFLHFVNDNSRSPHCRSIRRRVRVRDGVRTHRGCGRVRSRSCASLPLCL